MNLSKIHHIAIIVSYYEAAKDFYVNKLGFSVIRENYRPERKDWKLDIRVNEHTELEIFAEENPPKRVNRPEACRIAHFDGAAGFLVHPVQIGLGVRNFRLNLKNVCTDSIGKIFSNLCGNAAGGEVSNKSFAHDKCTSFD